MAQTYTNNDNVLSKVRFGNTTYYMKDAAVREIMDTFGNVVTLNAANQIAENGTGLVNAGQVYEYVGRQIGAIGQALNLLSATDHDDVAAPLAGDFVVESDGSEWLYDGESWREVGSENAYVVKSFTIAGIDMQDNIAVAELQEALGLKALAYKQSGSVKVTTIDSMSQFSTGAAGTYNVSATAVSVPETYDALDVTPAGSVAINAGTAAAASYDKTTGVTVSVAAPAEGQTANYTPSGNVTVTNVTVTPSTTSVATVTSAGQAYGLTDGSVAQAADSTSAFATEGVVVSIDENDSEMLVFTSAGTSNAVTASGAVTYTAPVLSGSLPTFGSANVVDGITSASASASFAGNGTIISASPVNTATDATVTQPTFTGSFTGTSKSVTPTVKTTVSAAGTDGSVTVASENITPAFTATEKTATVAFA